MLKFQRFNERVFFAKQFCLAILEQNPPRNVALTGSEKYQRSCLDLRRNPDRLARFCEGAHQLGLGWP